MTRRKPGTAVLHDRQRELGFAEGNWEKGLRASV